MSSYFEGGSDNENDAESIDNSDTDNDAESDVVVDDDDDEILFFLQF